MTEEKRAFLEAEEKAQDILETLEHLHEEMVSYKSSREQLETVGDGLEKLIGATEDVAKGALETVESLKSATEFFSKAEEVSARLSEIGADASEARRISGQLLHDDKQQEMILRLDRNEASTAHVKTILEQIHKENYERTKNIADRIDWAVDVFKGELRRVRNLVYVTIAMAGLAFVAGVTAVIVALL